MEITASSAREYFQGESCTSDKVQQHIAACKGLSGRLMGPREQILISVSGSRVLSLEPGRAGTQSYEVRVIRFLANYARLTRVPLTSPICLDYGYCSRRAFREFFALARACRHHRRCVCDLTDENKLLHFFNSPSPQLRSVLRSIFSHRLIPFAITLFLFACLVIFSLKIIARRV